MSTPDTLVHSFPAGFTSTANVGTAASGVTAVESRTGWIGCTRLSFTAKALSDISGAAAQGIGALLYTLPAGCQVISSSRVKLTAGSFAGNTAVANARVGLGTTIATGAVSVLNGTAGFMNLLTEQTIASVGTFTVDKTLGPTAGANLVIESAGAKTVHLNVAATWAAALVAPTVTGEVTIWWTFMGA